MGLAHMGMERAYIEGVNVDSLKPFSERRVLCPKKALIEFNRKAINPWRGVKLHGVDRSGNGIMSNKVLLVITVQGAVKFTIVRKYFGDRGLDLGNSNGANMY